MFTIRRWKGIRLMSSVRAPNLSALVLVVLALSLGISGAQTRADGGYNLSWFTVDGGGGIISGGESALSGTIGQYDAGDRMSGGDYSLEGGFWSGRTSIYPTFIPLVTR